MSASSEIPPIDPETATAAVQGGLDDAFALFGPQEVDGQIVLTALDPFAVRLVAVTDSGAHPLSPVPGAPGLFRGTLPSRVPYRLAGEDGEGRTWEAEDAYRFGPVLGEMDEYLLGEGTHLRLWQALGAHVMCHEGVEGTHFAVWAPNARRVSVVGDFNAWDGRRAVMRRRGASGVWEIFLPGIAEGTAYKYEIAGADGTLQPLKADPVGFGAEHPPATASIVRDISGYSWKDAGWMEAREARNRRDAPISIYEVHLGSWMRVAEDGGRPLSYREAAEQLVSYAAGMGFTHIEFMPLSEHPYDGSWGYQPVGLYAPTIRHGPPHEFRDLVDAAHRAGLGVILDWVPGHFPVDAHGLYRFDGTHLYEHADPREGYHPDWNTAIYNFGRTEVANFLVSNALYWAEEHHVDGLRVDAVASMLYRDYSREDGQWIPNKDGGRENYEAIALLQRMNRIVYGEAPGAITAAEESTSFPKVSQPVHEGGLGFGYKWNMGWMNDTLRYMAHAPIHRHWHHHDMTFGLVYAFSENFILPISHDEVVHGKGAMPQKMPGDDWEKFANLRAYYAFMWAHPGKKLMFMGCEFGQWHEWDHEGALDWQAAARQPHAGLRDLVRDLNTLYRETPALHVKDCEADGFQWIEADAAGESILAWIRRGRAGDTEAVIICNFTPVERRWRCGFPLPGRWREAINTDAEGYNGGGRGNMGAVMAEATPSHGQAASAEVTLPPLATLIFLHEDS